MDSNLEGIAEVLCKCGKNPRRPNAWTCADCHRAYMKDYARRHKGSRDTMQQRQWFQRGAAGFRAILVRHFTNIARGEMSGLTAAEITRQCPDPPFPVEQSR